MRYYQRQLAQLNKVSIKLGEDLQAKRNECDQLKIKISKLEEVIQTYLQENDMLRHWTREISA